MDVKQDYTYDKLYYPLAGTLLMSGHSTKHVDGVRRYLLPSSRTHIHYSVKSVILRSVFDLDYKANTGEVRFGRPVVVLADDSHELFLGSELDDFCGS